MTASLIEEYQLAQRGDGLKTTFIARDLSQIADLIELCFASHLDSSGRAAIREMRMLGQFGPLLAPLALLDLMGVGLAMGNVWRIDGRVVGNVSLYRGGYHPALGLGWLVANVAVHPDYRRQGMARVLMDAALRRVRQYRGRWIALQVDAENEAAYRLYDGMGFETYETLTQWESNRLAMPPGIGSLHVWPVRQRGPHEIRREIDFIYGRARQGGMAWTRPIEAHDFRGGKGPMTLTDSASRREYWVMHPPDEPARIAGSMWVVSSGWRRSRVGLFLDPGITDPDVRRSLLVHLLRRPTMHTRIVRLETLSDDEAINDLLHRAGFRPVRHLIQMRLRLT